MKRLAPVLIAGAILIAYLVTAFTESRPPSETALPAATPDIEAEGTGVPGPSARREGLQPQMRQATRVEEEAQALLRVVDDAGNPVKSALVWRLSANSEWLASGETATDAQGHAPLLGDDLEGPGVWITHDEFRPAFFTLDDERRMAQVLERGPATSVVVVDVAGAPLGGAVVYHEVRTGDLPDSQVPFTRTIQCDQNGRTSVQVAGDPQALWATQESLISAPWSGGEQPEGEITLTARATLSAFGAISTLPGSTGKIEGKIKCYARHEGEWILLASPPIQSGSWGPQDLPWIRDANYGFKLVGDGLLESFEDIGPTQAESRVQVDFLAEPGVALVVILLDTNDEPIEGATVGVAWSIVGEVNAAGVTAETDSTGTAHVKGVRPGTVMVNPKCEGFVSVKYGPIEIPLVDEDSVTINLKAAGVITGTCTLHAEPQEDFTVIYWQGHPHGFQSERVHGSTDGSFTINNTPLGEVKIYAISDAYPQGKTQRVQVSANETNAVQLELSRPVAGYGKVIELATGEPIAGASIQLWTSTGSSLQSQRGKAHQTRPDGTFRIPDFTVGSTRFVVSAPGFAYSLGQTFAEAGTEVDVGTITLERHQRLVVQLHSEHVMSFTEFSLEARGPQNAPLTDFSAEGVAVLPEIVSGGWRLTVWGPDDLEIYTDLIVYPRDDDWIVDISVDTTNKLEVVLPPETTGPSPAWVTCWSATNRGNTLITYVWLKDNVAIIENLTPGPATIAAFAQGGRQLGIGSTVIKLGENTLELSLTQTQFGVRVVDSRGAAVPDTSVRLKAPNDNPTFTLHDSTDETGSVEFMMPPYLSLVAILHNSGIGFAANIAVELTGTPDEVITIEMPDRVGLRCRLVDQGVPLPGIRVRVMAPDRQYITSFMSSDDTGLIEGAEYCEGEFLVMIDQARYWSTEALVHCDASGETTDIQVHRLADVAFDVRSTSGLTVRDQPVGLHSIEFDTDVAAWVAEGLVAAPSGMVTDSTGRLELAGLPRGDYRWTVVNSAGVATSGLVTLVAWVETPVAILLD